MFKLFKNCRLLHSSGKRNFEEVQIPFEWGPVAGKLWGSPDKRPVVALHGWQDNCGTFDTLIPKLRDDVSFLALDLPGHGYSAPFPTGLWPGTVFDYVIIIRRIQKYFGWEKVSFMSHSMGAITSFLFSLTFPTSVDFFICFDALNPFRFNLVKNRGQAIDDFLRYDELRLDDEGRPTYTMDALVCLLHRGSHESIDVDKCRYILERNIVSAPNDPTKYFITRDIRVKTGPAFQFPLEEYLEGSKHITAPVCVIKAAEKSIIDQGNVKNEFYQIWSTLLKSSADAQLVLVEGKHHVHLNNPERVADCVNNFLLKYYTHDRVPEQFERLQKALK